MNGISFVIMWIEIFGTKTSFPQAELFKLGFYMRFPKFNQKGLAHSRQFTELLMFQFFKVFPH